MRWKALLVFCGFVPLLACADPPYPDAGPDATFDDAAPVDAAEPDAGVHPDAEIFDADVFPDAEIFPDATPSTRVLRLPAVIPSVGTSSNAQRSITGRFAPTGGRAESPEHTVEGSLGSPR